MTKNTDAMDVAEARRELAAPGGIEPSRGTIKELLAAKLLLPPHGEPHSKKISRDSAERLKARRERPVPRKKLALRIPMKPTVKGPSLYLSYDIENLGGPSNDEQISKINHHLDASNRSNLKYTVDTRDAVSFTGDWICEQPNVDRLIKEGGYVLGVTGGFVIAVGEMLDLAMQLNERNRKVFAVRPLRGKELDPWLGYFPDDVRGPTLIEPL